jgi:hypothetical protein
MAGFDPAIKRLRDPESGRQKAWITGSSPVIHV